MGDDRFEATLVGFRDGKLGTGGGGRGALKGDEDQLMVGSNHSYADRPHVGVNWLQEG